MTREERSNHPLTEKLLNSVNTPDFVLERRRIIAQLIDEKRLTAADIVEQLIELQRQLDQLRAVNTTPLEQMQHIVLLIEELVQRLEELASGFRNQCSTPENRLQTE